MNWVRVCSIDFKLQGGSFEIEAYQTGGLIRKAQREDLISKVFQRITSYLQEMQKRFDSQLCLVSMQC